MIGKLGTIHPHHGRSSGATPYAMIEVIGVELCDHIRAALADYGFGEFAAATGGFTATASVSASGLDA